MREDIKEQLIVLMRTEMDVELPGTLLHHEISSHLDSMEKIELVMLLEKEYDITITNEVIEKCKTFLDIVDAICEVNGIV